MPLNCVMKKSAVLALLAGVLILAPGCDNSADTGPGGPTANLLVTFDPNPVRHFTHGEWLFTVYVTETAGVGVYIYGWVRQGYSGAGEPYAVDRNTEVQFIEEFNDCPGEENYIPAGGTRCGYYRIYDGINSGSETWTFYGIDDSGNEVSGEGTVDFL